MSRLTRGTIVLVLASITGIILSVVQYCYTGIGWLSVVVCVPFGMIVGHLSYNWVFKRGSYSKGLKGVENEKSE
jgi:FtsH-binding integral membrane protein